MTSDQSHVLDNEEIATLIFSLTLLLNDNTRRTAELTGRRDALKSSEGDLVSLDERQICVIERLLSKLAESRAITFR